MKYHAYVATFLLVFITIVSTSAASASNVNIADINATFLKQAYNESLKDIPDSYKSLIGDNRISLQIMGKDVATKELGLVTKNGQLAEAVDGALKDPTIEIEIKESALKKLQEAQDPVKSFNQAVDNKEISVKGNGFVNQVKATALLKNPVLPELLYKLLSPSKQTQKAG